MPRQNLEITGINGVGDGSIASVDFTTGRRYHDFLFRVGCTAQPSPTWAQMNAMIRKITLLANSRPVREFTVAELEEVLRFNDVARPVGRLPIFFSEPWRVTRAEEEFYALKADRLASLQLKVEFATSAQAGFSLAGLFFTGLQSFDQVRADHGSFVHWVRVSPPVTSAGVGYWKDLERVGAYSRIHILSNDVSRVKVKVGSDEIFDKTKSDNELLAAAYGFAANSANSFNIAFDYTGYNSDSLVMSKEVSPGVFVPVDSFEIEVTRTAGGGNLPALVEQIKTLG